jgi:hypothetical protein
MLLGTNIEPKSYAMGDIILEAGEYPQGLYIIKEG